MNLLSRNLFLVGVVLFMILPQVSVPSQWQQHASNNVYDFLELAAKKGIKPLLGEDQDTFLYAFSRGGVRRQALVITPGASFETEVADVPGRQCVSLMAGMPFNLGDGAVLRVLVQHTGGYQQLLAVSIDPAHNRSHREWLPVHFDLPSSSGTLRLRFAVSEGPGGDFSGDWLGLAPGTDSRCFFSAPQQR